LKADLFLSSVPDGPTTGNVLLLFFWRIDAANSDDKVDKTESKISRKPVAGADLMQRERLAQKRGVDHAAASR